MSGNDSSSDDDGEEDLHAQGLTPYELERQGNIARNRAVLAALGLGDGQDLIGNKRQSAAGPGGETRQKSKQPRKAKTERKPLPLSTRSTISTRSNKSIDTELTKEQPVAAAHAAARVVANARAFGDMRLTMDQRERLAAAVGGPMAAAVDDGNRDERLTEREARVCARVAAFVWAQAPDRDVEARRQTLRRACALFGLRQPPLWCELMEVWLSKLVTKNGPISPDNRAKTMWAIESMAVGLGFHYKEWPTGVGVLLRGSPEEPNAAPRLLTMRSDGDLLRLEGKRLEAAFGVDTGRGWGFNHPLIKFGMFQADLLAKRFDGERPAAPPLRGAGDDEGA